jgi:hypothetical protein
MECPYCEAGQEVNHDDGAGYDENYRHEHECSECGKTFVFTTSISYNYSPEKADCLNGGDHVVVISATYPREYSMMCCRDCDYKRKPRADEFAAAGIVLPAPPATAAKEGDCE